MGAWLVLVLGLDTLIVSASPALQSKRPRGRVAGGAERGPRARTPQNRPAVPGAGLDEFGAGLRAPFLGLRVPAMAGLIGTEACVFSLIGMAAGSPILRRLGGRGRLAEGALALLGVRSRRGAAGGT